MAIGSRQSSLTLLWTVSYPENKEYASIPTVCIGISCKKLTWNPETKHLFKLKFPFFIKYFDIWPLSIIYVLVIPSLLRTILASVTYWAARGLFIKD